MKNRSNEWGVANNEFLRVIFSCPLFLGLFVSIQSLPASPHRPHALPKIIIVQIGIFLSLASNSPPDPSLHPSQPLLYRTMSHY